MPTVALKYKTTVPFSPAVPYNFDANFHKPSHFPSSDNTWEEGSFWITMLWQGQELGLKFENMGNADRPSIKVDIFSHEALSQDYLDSLALEIKRRANVDSDISGFYDEYKNDKVLGPVIGKWRGMKPIATNSLYETLIIYIVLQNATVRRSVQMLENLFNKYGKKVAYDDQVLSAFWEPEQIAESSEQALRDLRIGYRAKFIHRLSEQFAKGEIDEFALRKTSREGVRCKILKLHGIGPASVEYLLFEYFYFCDTLETIPSWEQKIMSKLIFNRDLVSKEQILEFFRKYRRFEKLAFHYMWEDVFWRRKHEHIDWLEKEIRL